MAMLYHRNINPIMQDIGRYFQSIGVQNSEEFGKIVNDKLKVGSITVDVLNDMMNEYLRSRHPNAYNKHMENLAKSKRQEQEESTLSREERLARADARYQNEQRKIEQKHNQFARKQNLHRELLGTLQKIGGGRRRRTKRSKKSTRRTRRQKK